MKISLNWIRQLVDFDLPEVDELVKKIGAQLGEVESVENIGEKYQGIIVAKVVECYKHEDSDHLNVCKIDDGCKAQNVERDENGLVQVVCGAPNVRKGLLVAWLPPGSTVPSSYDKDPFVLEARELRGKKSNGMLASPSELAISDNHDGILEIDKDASPGDDFASVYKLDDTVIDIENKMFTHRPDCFGALGVAREIAGITGHKFKSPDWYLLDQVDIPLASDHELALAVDNQIEKLVPRFMAVALAGVEVKPSPIWLQAALSKLGQKPINNIVDLTNFYMLLTGQPLHAYDYDKLAGHKLGARLAKKGEKAELLNGKTYQLDESDIVIVDSEGAVGLAGVMGGLASEVTSATKNIVVECAHFDMYSIRRTSMRHGLFTDAVTRFTKGQSPLQNPAVLAKLVTDLGKLSGAKVAGDVSDIRNFDDCILDDNIHRADEVGATEDFINSRLGSGLSRGTIRSLLENVEFKVDDNEEWLDFYAPFWRRDIEEPEDIVEEVGRLYGYDKLPLELPSRSIKPASKDKLLELKASIRQTLAKAGANEVLTYSFVHGNLLEKCGQDPKNAFKLANALSPDLQYYRLSLMPSLLEKVHPNIKSGHDEFAIFELGKSHYVGEQDEQELTMPNEDNHLALVIAFNDKHKAKGSTYYRARKYLDLLDDRLVKELTPMSGFNFEKDEWGRQLSVPYDPKRSALIVRDGQVWGVLGEFRSIVQQALKLPRQSAGFEILLDVLNEQRTSYTELPKFPSVNQDITLKVNSSLAYGELAGELDKSLAANKPDSTLATLAPLGIYQPKDSSDYKNVSFRLTIASYEKTMKAVEVSKLLDAIASSAKTKLKAERV